MDRGLERKEGGLAMTIEKIFCVVVSLGILGLGCGGGEGAEADAVEVGDAAIEVDVTEEPLAAGTHIFTTAGGFTFSPELVTVAVDEEVHFHIEPGHTVLEVDFETWQKSGTTPLAGGFYFGLGESGGTVSFDEPGTHYYICEPHAEMDMRGQVIVE